MTDLHENHSRKRKPQGLKRYSAVLVATSLTLVAIFAVVLWDRMQTTHTVRTMSDPNIRYKTGDWVGKVVKQRQQAVDRAGDPDATR